MSEDYHRARKRGLKRFRADEAAGAFPYPPALDDLLEGQGRPRSVRVGQVELALPLVSGTKTRARQNVFASDFLPIAPETSEFAQKWSSLCSSLVAEGIRDPVQVFEYLHRFYVQEGNKRVSVSRYLDAPTIPAQVTRLLPADPADIPEAYAEFLRFYAVAPVYGVELSHAGDYERLARLMGQDLEQRWPDEKVGALRRLWTRFSQSCGALAEELGLSLGDALLAALDICGFEDLAALLPQELAALADRLAGEFHALAGGTSIAYLEDPAAGPGEAGLVDKFVSRLRSFYSIYHAAVGGPTVVAFIYDESPLTSRWTAAHEQGREALERRLGDSVRTYAYPGVLEDDDFEAVVADAVERGAHLVVTVSPTQMDQALRAAVKYPDVEFINCAVGLTHESVRVFSGRLYEAKFLLGALAAALSPDHRIGYVAESPVYNAVAEVNAFARGAELVDAQAEVHLAWQQAQGCDWRRLFGEKGIAMVSSSDFPDPLHPDDPWGLWRDAGDGAWEQVAAPFWDWGLYYERLVQSLRDDSWRTDAERLPNQALNYWWGLSSGVVDVCLGKDVPDSQRRLVRLLRQAVVDGELDPFSGELVGQEGPVQPAGSPRLESEAIAGMDWLAHNVVGRLPQADELTESGRKVVRVSGVVDTGPAGAES